MSKFQVIAFDVYKKNVKSIAFLVMILVPFILLGIVFLAGKLAGGIADVSEVGVVAQETAVAQQMTQLDSEDYTFKVFSSEDEAQKKLQAEDIDAYLVIDVADTTVSGKLYSESTLGLSTELVLQQFLTSVQATGRAQELGLSAAEVAGLNESAAFTKEKVSFDEAGEMVIGEDNTAVQFAVSYAATILLFVIILTYSQIIAQEIASEKGTRIMEVILSSTKAQTHYYGKIVGVLLVAVTQLALYGVIFGVSYPQIRKLPMVQEMLGDISLEKVFGSFLIFTLIFILLGILIYAILSALCGSLVNKPEDTAKAILPVTYLSLGGYMLGLVMGATDPNNVIIRVTSYIPFLSSYIMPVRLANETVSVAGAAISVVILAVTTAALMLVSARLYKSNVLVYSEGGFFASLKQSISIMQNEKKKA